MPAQKMYQQLDCAQAQQQAGGEKSRFTVTLKNLKIGSQDPQLFELPAGYNAMASMGGMFKGALPGMNRR